MIQRFQIEDIIAQDPFGVIFRAIDTETDHPVAVRRFFPFGADGGGLNPEEQAAYDIAVGRLAELRHPAMRAVICGGCDPVDGMPFIATEWIEGKSLEPIIGQGPLGADVAAEVITQALEVCELLSLVLAEEAIWVETELQNIIVGDETSGRGLTFWISPLKWLGGREHSRGLEAIVALTEELMGWHGRLENDPDSLRLNGWLVWLRGAINTASLREVRERLAIALNAEPPVPARQLVAQATRSLGRVPKSGPQKKSPVWANLALALGLTLVTSGVVGLWYVRRHSKESPVTIPEPTVTGHTAPEVKAIAPEVTKLDASISKPEPKPTAPKSIQPPKPPVVAKAVESNEDRMIRRAAELSELAAQSSKSKETQLAEQKVLAQHQGDVIPWTSRALLLEKAGKGVVVEGVVDNISPSSSGKTLYVWFSDKTEKNAARVGYDLAGADPAVVTANLTPFLGKKIRVSGTVVVRKNFGNDRPDIMIKESTSIKLAE